MDDGRHGVGAGVVDPRPRDVPVRALTDWQTEEALALLAEVDFMWPTAISAEHMDRLTKLRHSLGLA